MLVFMFMAVVARLIVVVVIVLVSCGILRVSPVEGIRPGEDQVQL